MAWVIEMTLSERYRWFRFRWRLRRLSHVITRLNISMRTAERAAVEFTYYYLFRS